MGRGRLSGHGLLEARSLDSGKDDRRSGLLRREEDIPETDGGTSVISVGFCFFATLVKALLPSLLAPCTSYSHVETMSSPERLLSIEDRAPPAKPRPLGRGAQNETRTKSTFPWQAPKNDR